MKIKITKSCVLKGLVFKISKPDGVKDMGHKEYFIDRGTELDIDIEACKDLFRRGLAVPSGQQHGGVVHNAHGKQGK